MSSSSENDDIAPLFFFREGEEEEDEDEEGLLSLLSLSLSFFFPPKKSGALHKKRRRRESSTAPSLVLSLPSTPLSRAASLFAAPQGPRLAASVLPSLAAARLDSARRVREEDAPARALRSPLGSERFPSINANCSSEERKSPGSFRFGDALCVFAFARARRAGGPRAARGLLLARGVRAERASPSERIHVRNGGEEKGGEMRESWSVFFFFRCRRRSLSLFLFFSNLTFFSLSLSFFHAHAYTQQQRRRLALHDQRRQPGLPALRAKGRGLELPQARGGLLRRGARKLFALCRGGGGVASDDERRFDGRRRNS